MRANVVERSGDGAAAAPFASAESFEACVRTGTMLEINANPDRRDLSDLRVVERRLNELILAYPTLARLSALDEEDEVLASVNRGRPIDPQTEHQLVVKRPLIGAFAAKPLAGSEATPAQLNELETLQEKARGNGVADLAWLSRGEVKAMEPEVSCAAALPCRPARRPSPLQQIGEHPQDPARRTRRAVRSPHART